MNIHGTKDKLLLSKTLVRELNQSEWDLVGGGSAGESFNCQTMFCSQTCQTVNCYTVYCFSATCPTVACN